MKKRPSLASFSLLTISNKRRNLMNIRTRCPDQLSSIDTDQIVRLAGIGFGQGDTPEMRKDAMHHIMASDYVQTAHDNQHLVAFAMVRRCLWQ